MKKFLAIALALCMVFALCACGATTASAPAASTDTKTEAAAPAADKVYTLRLATQVAQPNPLANSAYRFADAVAEKCSRSLDKLKAEYISASEDAESTAAHLLSEAERISRRMTTLGAMLADSADAFSELDFRR